MNTTSDTVKKERVLKSLAVGGFIGLIIIIAWLGITLVRVLPNAFTSLASLADSVYNYQPVKIVIVTSEDIVNAGDSFTISWNDPKPAGSFSFTYACTEGVAIEVRTIKSYIQSVTCDVPFELGDVTSMDVTVRAERNRFTDIPYTISFITPRAIDDVATAEGTISVVNASITAPEPVATTTPEVTPTPETPKPTTPVVTKPPVSKPTTPVPPKPTYIQTPIYGIPVSNPNGTTDLSIRSLGAGTISSNNQFINVGTINGDTDSAIQFEIKNLGTKTSDTFTFTATLPNGTTYTSPVQAALKPNERSVISLGFTMNGERGVKVFSAIVSITNDTNTKNNSFTSAVTVK